MGRSRHANPALLGCQATDIEQHFQEKFLNWPVVQDERLSVFALVFPGEQQALAVTPPEGYPLLLNGSQNIFSRWITANLYRTGRGLTPGWENPRWLLDGGNFIFSNGLETCAGFVKRICLELFDLKNFGIS